MSKRERHVMYLRKSRAVQARMKVVLAVGVIASLALFAIGGPTWGVGFLVLTLIVVGTSFWITAAHIRDFQAIIRAIDDAAEAAGGQAGPPQAS